MSSSDEYIFAVGAADRGQGLGDQVELLPTVLVQAITKVLPVAGAGLSVTDALRGVVGVE